MNLCLAGEGAIAQKHLDALARLDADVVAIAGGDGRATAEVADRHGIPHRSLDLDECLALPEVEAVLLATPTPLHAEQAERSLRAGKHVLVEIPMADSLEGARRIARVRAETGLCGMACHTRRFNSGHRWLHERFAAGELTLRHLVVETFFFRRENVNALGVPRSWSDDLLWHHACHTVDLFAYQLGEPVTAATALAGPRSESLGIVVDLSIGLAAPSGALCTLAISFNNKGPIGTWFRYICDEGTFVAYYDELRDGDGHRLEVGRADGIEMQDAEFIAAVREGRAPNASFEDCLPAMETLARLEALLR